MEQIYNGNGKDYNVDNDSDEDNFEFDPAIPVHRLPQYITQG
jgi:hypothetical protein